MIVHPDFLDHWKTRRLVSLTGNQASPLLVLRLWAYCQQRKGNCFPGMSAADLAVACHCTELPPETLKSYLLECRFIRIENETDLVVHGWHETNRMLISAWENGAKGGHRASKTRDNTGNRPVNRQVTDRLTHGRTHPNSSGTVQKELERVNRPVTPGEPIRPGTDLEILAGAREEKKMPSLKLIANAEPVQDPAAVKKFGQLVGTLAQSLRSDKAN